MVISTKTLKRAELFAAYSGRQILFVENPFGDGMNLWFVALNFVSASPSNHIHHNELREGLCINELMELPQEVDKVLFNTKLEEIHRNSLSFHSDIKWITIR